MNLTRDALLFSPTREGVPSSDDNFTANDLVAAQDALEKEARDVLPFSFNTCTYDLGYIKQPVYSCRTCLNDSGICSGCSIACHGEHELVELFSRRHFRCDCGTERMGAGSHCSIVISSSYPPRKDAERNLENYYDKTFKGSFCFCGKPYDPMIETDAMYQCIVCEDWMHHACLFGHHNDDAPDDAPLGADDFEHMICGDCVKNKAGVRIIMEKYAGVDGTGVMLITSNDKVLGALSLLEPESEIGAVALPISESGSVVSHAGIESKGHDEETAPVANPDGSTKRKATDDPPAGDSEAPSEARLEVKKIRIEASSSTNNDASCTAPQTSTASGSILSQVEQEGGKSNIYLAEDFYTRWCRCSRCLPMFSKYPYLLEEEDVYEPPEDLDAQKSTLELGMDALNKIPRAQAIEGAIAFQGLSDRLKAFLKPYADSNQTITKELVEEFFGAEKEKLREARR